MARLSFSSLLALLANIRHASSWSPLSESITGFSTVGDHFGYPAFANATYDYVVVGGGTAGLAVAAKLAEGEAGTVAVIEAGGFYEFDNGNLSTVPGTAAYFIGTAPFAKNPLVDWQYQTETNPVSTTGSKSRHLLSPRFLWLIKANLRLGTWRA